MATLRSWSASGGTEPRLVSRFTEASRLVDGGLPSGWSGGGMVADQGPKRGRDGAVIHRHPACWPCAIELSRPAGLVSRLSCGLPFRTQIFQHRLDALDIQPQVAAARKGQHDLTGWRIARLKSNRQHHQHGVLVVLPDVSATHRPDAGDLQTGKAAAKGRRIPAAGFVPVESIDNQGQLLLAR